MKKGYIVWLTGLPCSGKTTIAKALEERLDGHYCDNVLLDGDSLRFDGKPITGITGFSPEERKQHLLRVASIANYEAEVNGNIVICSFVSPSEEVRQEIKDMLRYMYVVHVDCPEAECMDRDVKGMWAKAKAGEIKGFTGYDAEYQIPEDPDVVVATDVFSVDECVDKIVNMLNEKHRRDVFFGRWQAPEGIHDGHKALINTSLKAGKPVTIFIREMIAEKNKNPYDAYDIEGKIVEAFKNEDVEVVVGPNLNAVCYGRGVGYEVKEIKLGEEVESISATKLRAEEKK